MEKHWMIKWMIFSIVAVGIYYLVYWFKSAMTDSNYEVPLAFIMGAFYFKNFEPLGTFYWKKLKSVLAQRREEKKI